jgi:hypothetical protein
VPRTADQAAGLSLAEIREILAIRDQRQPPCTHVTAPLRSHLDQTEQRLAELTATRVTPSDLLATADATDPGTGTGTGTGSICRILDPPASWPAGSELVSDRIWPLMSNQSTASRDHVPYRPPSPGSDCG